MAVEIPTVGRTRVVTGSLYLELWIQGNQGTDQVAVALNTLDAAADAAATGSMWYGAPSPGEFDPGVSEQDWYFREIRIPFKSIQAPGQWAALFATIEAFVYSSLPGEDIHGPNRFWELPAQAGDLSAKCWAWDLEFD